MTNTGSREQMLFKVREIASACKGRADQLIYVLKSIQKVSDNTITEDIAKIVAEELNVPVAHVYEVATFYAFFSIKKRGVNVIRMCKSAPCHINGAREVLAAFENALGIEAGQTTPDGKFTLETCECLGVCQMSPAALINEDVYGNLTPEKVGDILASY